MSLPWHGLDAFELNQHNPGLTSPGAIKPLQKGSYSRQNSHLGQSVVTRLFIYS